MLAENLPWRLSAAFVEVNMAEKLNPMLLTLLMVRESLLVVVLVVSVLVVLVLESLPHHRHGYPPVAS